MYAEQASDGFSRPGISAESESISSYRFIFLITIQVTLVITVLRVLNNLFISTGLVR